MSLQFIVKCVVSGFLVGLISELAKRSALFGGLLASLPVTSTLAILWLYIETKDTHRVSDLVTTTLYFILPSLAFFILLPLLLQKLPFYVSLLLSAAATVACYEGMFWIMRRTGIMLLVACMLLPSIAFGHGGHPHGDAPGTNGGTVAMHLHITPEMRAKLGIESVEATLGPITKSVELAAEILPSPRKYAAVSVRFEGKLLETLVTSGKRVAAGEPILKTEPLAIGSAPVTVRAPISGELVRYALLPGETFTPQTLLAEIADTSRIMARAVSFDSSLSTRVHAGQNVRFLTDGSHGEVFEGIIDQVDVALDPKTRSFGLLATFDNPDKKLKLHTTGRLLVDLGETIQGVIVPTRALLGEEGFEFLFVDEGEKLDRRNVVVGIRNADRVEIIEGVVPGERVVVRGHYPLQYAPPETAHHEEHEHAHDSKHEQDTHAQATSQTASYLKWIVVIIMTLCIALIFWIKRAGSRGRYHV